MWITVGPDEGLFCCTDGETLGRWCSQYEFIGLNAGPSFFVHLLIIPVTRSGLVGFAWSWHSICGISAIRVNLTGDISVVSDFGVDTTRFECVGGSAVRREMTWLVDSLAVDANIFTSLSVVLSSASPITSDIVFTIRRSCACRVMDKLLRWRFEAPP